MAGCSARPRGSRVGGHAAGERLLLAFVEKHLLDVPERVRRCLSHFGALHGCRFGAAWELGSYDATNCIYGGVWEYWKKDEGDKLHPYCLGITNNKAAGNIIEALCGR